VCGCKYFFLYVNIFVKVNVCGCKYFFLFVNIFVKIFFFTLHFAFERTLYGVVFELTCICSTAAPHLTDAPLHTCIRPYPVRSNADTDLRSNSHASVQMQRPLHTHTLNTYAIERTNYVRSHAFLALFRSLFLSLFPISPPHRTTSSPISLIPLHPISLKSKPHHHLSFPPPPLHHRSTSTPPPPIADRPFPHFSPFSPKTQSPPKPHFSSIFFFFGVILGHKSIHGLCPLFVLLIVSGFAGVWVGFEKGSQTLWFWVAHHVLDKEPQPLSSMLISAECCTFKPLNSHLLIP
jgi:hypothetical protein